MLNVYIILMISLVAETAATTMIKASNSFTRLMPSIIVILGYAISFYGLSQVVKKYEYWRCLCHMGWRRDILGFCVIFFYLQTKLDFPVLVGQGGVAVGIIIIQLFSKLIEH